jgi:hypothetical protein
MFTLDFEIKFENIQMLLLILATDLSKTLKCVEENMNRSWKTIK